MAGGKGKIKPEDGKQFSSEYQPPERWTEEAALQLGNELIAWQKAKPLNIFFEEFLILEKDLYPNLIGYLSNKFSSFLHLLERAKKIQEIKLQKYGLVNDLNASIVKFCLVNTHGWKDRSAYELTGKDGQDLMPARTLSKSEMKELLEDLEHNC